jgi:CRP-like cAMP-binding protein
VTKFLANGELAPLPPNLAVMVHGAGRDIRHYAYPVSGAKVNQTTQAGTGMTLEELRTNVLFEGLTAEQLAALAPLFTRLHCVAGEVFFTQGSRADQVYILQQGRVNLGYQPEDGGWITITTLTESGNVFGWSAVLGHQHYTSTSVCLTEAEVWRVSGADLRAALRADSDLHPLLDHMILSVAQRSSLEPLRFARLFQREFSDAQP